ncbi:MAG: hypothetical protein Q8Q48_03735 [Candidatus Staskawiczbacteria bacterium]|nr:hypothetical protein [Candidatus Staskawiczbacteria bacterium]
MKRSMKIMTSKEKREFILLPIVMTLLCVFLGLLGTMVVLKDEKPDLVYLMWVVAGFFFVYGATVWWDSLRAWKNGKSCRRGLKERGDGPEDVVEK